MLDKRKLKGIVIKTGKFPMDAEQVTDETGLFADLLYDSLSLVELIVQIEDEFNIVLDDSELDMQVFNTFGSLCSMMSNKIEE